MTETFYRFHWADCPELSAHNAWSALWGAERSADGTQTRCGDCAGKGKLFEFDEDNCPTCDGEGWEDCVEGYSACESADELAAYFAERGEPGDGQVIVFEGARVGTGFDGEALAVPTRVVKTMTWAEFAEESK